jgi:hypothetical protein
MRYLKWIGLAAAILLVVTCFTPWITVPSKGIVVSGVDAAGTTFGKPGYFNLVMTVFFIFFQFMPRVWAKRANLLVVALNLAWAIRNYFILTACSAGTCPEKETGIYLLLTAAVFMFIAGLFPDMELKKD